MAEISEGCRLTGARVALGEGELAVGSSPGGSKGTWAAWERDG